MQLQGESTMLAPIFELFPRFREEIKYLLRRNNGHIEDVTIDYDGDSLFCGFVIHHDGGEIGIDFFSITQTMFVDFWNCGQLPIGYRLDFDRGAWQLNEKGGLQIELSSMQDRRTGVNRVC